MVGLAPVLPGSLMVGMEIRDKVAEYVRLRILAMRRRAVGGEAADADADAAAVAAAAEEAGDTGAAALPPPAVDGAMAATHHFNNASVLQSNAMKYLPCYFFKGQLSKAFFCFPDPHFKVANHRRRIVTTELLAEYAYALREGGTLYTITDVLDLHNWMAKHAAAHPCFDRIPDAELASDPAVPVMRTYTEEGQKVERNRGDKYVAVFRRLTAAQSDAKAATHDFWSPPAIDYVHLPAAAQVRNQKARVAGATASGGASAGGEAVDAPSGKPAAKRAKREEDGADATASAAAGEAAAVADVQASAP
jgi:tRNA (guanine-N(7)-)-methyltransferase